MLSVTWRAGESSSALEHARRGLIKRRLPLFGFAWLTTIGAWEIVLTVEHRIGEGPGVLLVCGQAIVLAIVVALCRADAAGRRVRPLAVGLGVLLGLSSTVLFADAASFGEVLAFVLLTLYLMAALLFAWGWKPELLLMLATLAPGAFLVPSLRLFVPPLELATAIAIGAALALAIAEGSARTFRISFLRRESEEEMKRELKASRDAYRDLAENAQDLIYTIDLEGRFTYVNEALARYVGEPASALVGRRSVEIVSPHPSNADVPALMAALARGENVGPDIFLLRSIDGVRWVEAIASSMRDAAGRVIGARGIGRDVTQRKHAEDALRESEERFRSAFGSASIGMAVVALDGSALQVNGALCEMLGYGTREMLGAPFQALTHPDDVDEHATRTRALIEGRIRRLQREERYLHRDGHVVWGLLSSSLVRSPDGAPLYLISQIQDITERKVAEAALRESEERFRSVFENAPIGMTVVALDGRTIQVNRALCRMLGYEEGELLRITIQSTTYGPDLPESIANAHRLLHGDTSSFQIEKRYIHKDGNLVWSLLSASLVRSAGGEPLYIIAQMQDITSRKHAENAVRDSEQRYRELVESQQDVLVRFDRSGRVTFTNDSLCRTLGLPREAILGRSFLHFVHEEDRPAATGATALLHGAAAPRDPREPRAHARRLALVQLGITRDPRRQRRGRRDSIGRPRRHRPSQRRGGAAGVAQGAAPERGEAPPARATAGADPRGRAQAARLRPPRRRLPGARRRRIMVASLRRRLAPLPPEPPPSLDRVGGYLNEVVEHLRLLARELRPMLLRDLGLEGSLRSLPEGMSCRRGGRRPRFRPRSRVSTEETEVAVYRIAQEALANAVRHAGRAHDRAHARGRRRTCSASRCATTAGDSTRRRPAEALGLASMEERALALGGRLEIRSASGAGTTVRLSCPLAVRAPERVREPAGRSPTRSSSRLSAATRARSAARD